MEDVNTDVSAPGAETQPVDTAADNSGGFFVPDAYKNEGWTRNLRSYDDLWKTSDSAQKMIGKKTIGIPDDKSSEQEIADFYSKLRPGKAEDYNIELDGDDKALFEKLFYDNGISARQAKALVDGYKESIERVKAPMFSADGYKQTMTERFGDKAEAKIKSVVDFVNKEGSREDKELLNALPNNVLGIVFGLIDKVQTRYAANDSDASASTGGGISGQADYSGYVKAAEELSRKPHTMADIEALKSKFNIPIIK